MTTAATKEELIAALRRAADELGETPTCGQMRKVGEYPPHYYQREFGRWNVAIEEAGLDVNQPRAADWSVSDFVDDLDAVAETVGRTPRRDDVDEHGEWDVTTYQERVPDNAEKSQWNTVLERCGFEPYYEIRDTVVKHCDACGDKMELKEYNSERRFCSDECQGEYWSKNYSGEDSWSYNSVTVECEVCDTSFSRIRSHAERTENNFCSQQCYGEWLSKNVVGDEHPNWKDEVATYGPGWNEEKRERVRERDGRKCQACGKPESEELADIGCKLSVHHIIPADQFDDPKRRNSVDNLVSLCHSHHMKWEGIPLKPELMTAV